MDGYTLLVGQEPRTVYPVILPAGAKIDYIEVKDKTGKLQRVKPARGEALTGLERVETSVDHPHGGNCPYRLSS